VEAQTDLQTYMEQGKEALAHGQAREAAIAYAHAAQLDPGNPMVHLGLAEANLALGDYRVVKMACQRTQELQPASGSEAMTAQALLDLLNRRYERALQDIDAVISENPTIAYAHALRSYLLRTLHQDYDAQLARSRATRLSFGGNFENCFPPIEPSYASGYSVPSSSSAAGQTKEQTAINSGAEREPVPTWSPSNGMQRQMVRTRFVISQHPTLVTNAIIVINLVIYTILAVLSQSLDINQDVLVNAGAQNTPLIEATGQYWRIFTAMFLHFSIFHVGLNMLSLFFIGRAVEIFYGKWRYLVIYLVSGIVGGIATFFLEPNALAAGASGAIFGIFGALGVLYLVNRRAFGGSGAIGQWLFWLALNLVWGFSNTSIGIIDHIGGLVAGMIIAYLLIPRVGRRSI
jgi:membrane associated rhomboid family serine protease